MADEDVTNGELHRRLTGVETEVHDMRGILVEIRTALAGQAVKVGVVWAGLGMAAAALITALVSIALR